MKISYRYSLRLFLLICVCMGAAVGVSVNTARKHEFARRHLLKTGFDSFDGFEDPIGPNWFYTGRNVVPNNGRFSKWFSDYFCTKGSFACWIDNLEPEQKDWKLLKDLIHLRRIRIVDSTLPRNWVGILSECKELESILIIGTQIGREDFDDFKNLGVKSIEIYRSDVSFASQQFIDSLCEIESLENLELSQTGLSQVHIEELRRRLPGCSVNQ